MMLGAVAVVAFVAVVGAVFWLSEQQARKMKAVSYTHLTLPTIVSV